MVICSMCDRDVNQQGAANESTICSYCRERRKRKGRVCRRPNCEVKLSTLNKDSECFIHAYESRVRKNLASGLKPRTRV